MNITKCHYHKQVNSNNSETFLKTFNTFDTFNCLNIFYILYKPHNNFYSMGNTESEDDHPQEYEHIVNPKSDKGKYSLWRKPIQPIRNLTASEYLQELFYTIKGNQQLTSVLNLKYFQLLSPKIDQNYWTADDHRMITKIIEEYVQFCSKQLQTLTPNDNVDQSIKEYAEQFNYRVVNAVSKSKTTKAILSKISQYCRELKKNFKFTFEQGQINQICDDVRLLASDNSLAICYFSQYFVKCCENWEKKEKSIDEINSNLKKVAEKLKDRFGVLNTRKQLGQALGNNGQFAPSQSLMSKFEAVKRLNYKPIKIKFSSQNKEEQLEQEIMKFVNFGIKNISYFNSIVENACLSNEGFQFKSNLKLTSSKNKSSLMRVKQKLLKPFMKDAKPVSGCSSIEELIEKEEKHFQKLMSSAYENLSEVEFSVSDILRGKCLFSKKQSIFKAAEEIMNRVEEQAKKGKSIAVVEVDDRFNGICQDLVFKIRIGDLVCEFQMALNFMDVENSLHHKMYELVRSKLLSPIYILYDWNQKATTDLFVALQKLDNGSVPAMLTQMKSFFTYRKQSSQEIFEKYVKQQRIFVNRISEFLQPNNISLQKLQKINNKREERVKSILTKADKQKKQVKIADFQRTGNLTVQLNNLNMSLAKIEKKQGKYSIEAASVLVSIGAIYNLFNKHEIAHVFFNRAESIYEGIDLECDAYFLSKFEHAQALIGLKRYQEAVYQYLGKCSSYFDRSKQSVVFADVQHLQSKCLFYLKDSSRSKSCSGISLNALRFAANSANKQIIVDKLIQFGNFWTSVNETVRAQEFLKESQVIAAKVYTK